jgi:hypothetical protein
VPTRPNLGCGVLTRDGSYHARCNPRRIGHNMTERRRRKDAVDDWVAEHGPVCPGYGNRSAHWSSDLTADHAVPVAAGGAEDGALVVRCRSCNSGRGSRLY